MGPLVYLPLLCSWGTPWLKRNICPHTDILGPQMKQARFLYIYPHYLIFLKWSTPIDKPTGPTYKIFLNYNIQESYVWVKRDKKEISQTEITEGKENNLPKKPSNPKSLVSIHRKITIECYKTRIKCFEKETIKAKTVKLKNK